MTRPYRLGAGALIVPQAIGNGKPHGVQPGRSKASQVVYESSGGKLGELFELLAPPFGVSLFISAAALLDIVRRWWTARRATQAHWFFFAAPIVLPLLGLLVLLR